MANALAVNLHTAGRLAPQLNKACLRASKLLNQRDSVKADRAVRQAVLQDSGKEVVLKPGIKGYSGQQPRYLHL